MALCLVVFVKELPTATPLSDNHARSSSMGGAQRRGNGDFEKRTQRPPRLIYRPEILHTRRGPQYANLRRRDLWNSSPGKFGAPLNFAFALRPMGRKISNRLYATFRSCFWPSRLRPRWVYFVWVRSLKSLMALCLVVFVLCLSAFIEVTMSCGICTVSCGICTLFECVHWSHYVLWYLYCVLWYLYIVWVRSLKSLCLVVFVLYLVVFVLCFSVFIEVTMSCGICTVSCGICTLFECVHWSH